MLKQYKIGKFISGRMKGYLVYLDIEACCDKGISIIEQFSGCFLYIGIGRKRCCYSIGFVSGNRDNKIMKIQEIGGE